MTKQSKQNSPPFLRLFASFWFDNEEVAGLTAIQRGGLINLLLYAFCVNWPECDLPNDKHLLAQISCLYDQWDDNKEAILKCFSYSAENDRMTCPYLEQEKSYKLGKSIPVQKRKQTNVVESWFEANPKQEEMFQEFHALYPRKDGLVEPRKEWKAANIKPLFFPKLIEALKKQIATGHLPSKKEDLQYCMQERRWLHGKHWQDNITHRNGNGSGKTSAPERPRLSADDSAKYRPGETKFGDAAPTND